MSNVRYFMRKLIILFIALFPVLAHAEVMDKEFSLITVFLCGVLSVLLVFLAARLKPWLLLVLLPLVGMFFYLQLTELIDPYVGPAIAKEAGIFYIVISWAAPVLVIVSGIIGFVLRLRNFQSIPNQSFKRDAALTRNAP